ncbi:putative sugar transporter STL1 [Myriangium duriaei CBS 260.36]|uniref:Sugar transporter STL1 n=1 Tax=Myriangium duriaei CBS 260.36 TaxID=1168546 RepID=A0A9P4MDE3_9PEZI|nr:putative sugar transporter STL1 [Myriangium duriaei CBS 260.36]
MGGLDGVQGKTLYNLMSAACGSAFMLYGWDAGVLGGIQATPQFLDAIGNPKGAFVIPIIASIYNLAAGIMSLCVSFFGMKIGRKGTILLGCLLICIGALLQASTYSVGQIIFGRIVTGSGIGCIASAVPTYMAEMSLEARERGPEVSYQLALLITGVALAYWVDLGFVQGLDKHPWLWRIPLAMQSCFAIFAATLLFFLPDTPRWYYARGHEAKGDEVLARLHALPLEHPAVQFVKQEIKSSLEEEDDTGKLSITILFWDNTELQFGRRLRTSFLINWAQQFLGINMLVYFSTTIFSNLHYSTLLSGVLAGVLNTAFAIASYPPIYYIEKVGRRAMMIWSALGCGVCMLVYVVLTTLPPEKTTVGTNWAAAAIIILYEIVFAFGWLGTCWIYGPEIAPLKYRHVAGSLGAAGEWFSTWVMVFGGGTGINAVGPKIFVWPLICCFLAAAYVYFLCPETTGKTLEEIDALFARSPEVRQRLEEEIRKRKGSVAGPMGRRASMGSARKASTASGIQDDKMGTTMVEKI